LEEKLSRLILTRHGETLWNVQKRVQGWQDSALTENGRWQAQCLARRLREESIDYLYASDMPRALATAKAIQECLGLREIITASALRELSFGEWEGKAWADLKTENPEFAKIWESEPHRALIPGGESFQEVTDRVWDWLQSILEKHPRDTVCIVTHGLTLKLLITKALGFALEGWTETPWQHNTALNILEYQENRFQPVLLGDCGHLESELAGG
jgi:probable phosphoglycerate mutase